MQRIQARNLGGTSTGSVIVRYATYWVGFTAGVIANRQEQELYRKHPEQPLAEVLGIYFGGLVLIMARGKSVSAEESTSLRERFPESDLTDPANIGRFPAGLRFIDYGYPTLPAIFGAQAQ